VKKRKKMKNSFGPIDNVFDNRRDI